MPVDHREIAFESAIEDFLVENGGYAKGDPTLFDPVKALDADHVVDFIRDTQAETWDELERYHKGQLATAVVDTLVKNLESRGTLDVLRHGFKFYGKLISMGYFAPAHSLNLDIKALYDKNRLTITRQVHYSMKDTAKSVDVVVSLNGLPVATLELKNPMSGQSFRRAISQYKTDRDPKETLFQFRRGALVHFAVDTDEAHMTTRLAGDRTFFIPFNRGNGTGAGNPENPNGYKTAYLWEQILERHTWLDIIARFLHLEVEEKRVDGKQIRSEKMIFPRYHQWEAVQKLEADARKVGVGKNYLIQHSAGSGKSNSIAWLAHRLSSLHTEANEKVFDSVIVITDRRVLDQQLQDTIYQFEHKQGVVQKVDQDSKQLAHALASGVPIVITTLQKFPFVTDHIDKLPERKYAVIVDEAHSSQSGESAKRMKEVLAAESLEEAVLKESQEKDLDDYEEEIVRTMAARGPQPNMSFFAFTATPKHKTLEMFGKPGPDGKPQPFHLYSMRQAIDEEFILDVLKHYTTYKTYYKLVKSVEDDPEVDKKKAARALARFMSLHPHNVAQKTEVMIEHFRTFTRHKIGGRAKAMVVTRSRLHAVRYKNAFDQYIREKGYKDIKTLVAFSGKVQDETADKVYTEVEMNDGIRESELPETFATEEFQVLLVAEKYQTGFDQPLLHTMYVDKRLSGVHAVQTLSRLNRTHPGKEDTFVLDFVNDGEEIKAAFQPYYERATVSETADPQLLYDMQHKLNDYQVYYKSEVESFCKVFFKPKRNQSSKDHAMLNSYVDPSVDRFKQLAEEEQDEYRKLLSSYRNLYAFLSQIIPYQDSDLEKLYAFGRFLLTKLPRRDTGPQYEFDSEVSLQYYRLQKISEGEVDLKAGEGEPVSGPTSVGKGSARGEQVRLSSLIEVLNDRFGTDFSPSDQLFFDQIKRDANDDAELHQAAQVNNKDNFRFVSDPKIESYFIERMEQNDAIFTRFMNDPRFRETVSEWLSGQIYEELHERS